MIVKIHKKDNRTIAAVCDTDLMGQKFEEGDLQLDLSSDFYNGDEMNETEVGDLMRNSDGVNLVGENSIKLGLKEGIIDKTHIITIKKIPHAQAIIIHE